MSKRGKGEGSIFYSKAHKKWIGQFNNGYKDNGKLNRKTIYGRTRLEVSEKMKELQSLVAKEQYCDKSLITFKDLATDIVETKFKTNINGANTYGRNLRSLKKFGYVYKMEIQKITPRDVQNILNTQTKFSKSTIEKVYLLFNDVFKEAIKRKIIYTNPMNYVIKPKPDNLQKNKVSSFTYEEEQLILNNLENEEHRNELMIAFHTGMRIGEILALTPDDIDFEKKQINIDKTITKDINQRPAVGKMPKTINGIRTIPIIDALEPYLRDAVNKYTPNENKLLFHYKGKPRYASGINYQLKRICKDLGIREKIYELNRKGRKINCKTSNVYTHMTRHTYATRCIESGMPPVVLQRLLGHHDVSITLNTYTSVFSEFQKDSIQLYIDYMNKDKKENENSTSLHSA